MSTSDVVSLKLPPLVKLHLPRPCENKTEVCEVFRKLSKLHNRLQDPLKKLLYQCAKYEGDLESKTAGSLVSCTENLMAREALPCEVYSSPPPEHGSFGSRSIFRQKSKACHDGSVRATPMTTVLVRYWIIVIFGATSINKSKQLCYAGKPETRYCVPAVFHDPVLDTLARFFIVIAMECMSVNDAATPPNTHVAGSHVGYV
ncbi:hypothetical protein NDU88_004600 [Pleurodeles waltl]|uniref:Uncharacterized protein n=1 Tax=Pleurodeles waltl TaxID=8319 RepID=A0AAV7VGP0_PLEWA|nr:hypothetical protein NDU88_004600 [Pleurodeles waltl]